MAVDVHHLRARHHSRGNFGVLHFTWHAGESKHVVLEGRGRADCEGEIGEGGTFGRTSKVQTRHDPKSGEQLEILGVADAGHLLLERELELLGWRLLAVAEEPGTVQPVRGQRAGYHQPRNWHLLCLVDLLHLGLGGRPGVGDYDCSYLEHHRPRPYGHLERARVGALVRVHDNVLVRVHVGGVVRVDQCHYGEVVGRKVVCHSVAEYGCAEYDRLDAAFDVSD